MINPFRSFSRRSHRRVASRRKSSSRRRAQRTGRFNGNSHSLRGEALEQRMLLAADFHNARAPVDVDENGWLNNLDALIVISDLRNNGPRELFSITDPTVGNSAQNGAEGESILPNAMVDVNGDNRATFKDALDVISALRADANGDNDIVEFSMKVTAAPGGDPIQFIGLGETAYLEVSVEDIRQGAPPANLKGVASAFMDLFYDEPVVEVFPIAPAPPENFDFEVTFGPEFNDPVFTHVGGRDLGFINQIGSTSNDISQPLGPGEFLLFTIPFSTIDLGTATFRSAFEDDPVFITTVNEPPLQVLGNDIVFGSTQVTVINLRAVADTFTLAEDSVDVELDVLANDVSTDGPAQLVAIAADPTNGTVTINENGTPTDLTDDTVLYTPNADYFGPDSFTYQMSDGVNTAAATVDLTITEVNDVPIVQDETFRTRINRPLTISLNGLLVNDLTGPPNESDQRFEVPFPFDPVTTEGGTIVDNANGTITYTPATDFVGTDTFTYMVIDDGTTNGVVDPQATQGTVTITITDFVPTAQFILKAVDPNTGAEIGAVAQGESFELQVFIDDIRPDDGTPDRGFGAAYVDVDFFSDTGEALVTTDQIITFGDAYPNARRGTVTNSQNPGVIDEAGAASFDPNSTPGADPVLVFSTTFTAIALFSGEMTFNANRPDLAINEVVLADTGDALDLESEVLYDSLQISVEVLSPSLPTGRPESYSTVEDQTLVVSNPGDVSGNGNPTGPAPFGVLANDTDPDQPPAWPPGTVLKAFLVDPPHDPADPLKTPRGQLTLEENGTFTYVPQPDDFGTVVFTYIVKDPIKEDPNGPQTVTITIDPISDPPVANDDLYFVELGETITIPAPGFLANDIDPDAPEDAVPRLEPGSTVVITSGPSTPGASFTSSGDGSFSFTPAPNAEPGTMDAVTYSVTDSAGVQSLVDGEIKFIIGSRPAPISGFVYFDGGNDGVKSPGERGVGGVTVRLEGRDRIFGDLVDQVLITKSDGSYIFPDILPGDYTLTQESPLFLLDGKESINNVAVPGSDITGHPANDVFEIIGPNASLPTEYNFGELGLHPRFLSLLDFVLGNPESGITVAFDATANQQWYLLGTAGWENVSEVEVILSANRLHATIEVIDVNGDKFRTTVNTFSNPSFVLVQESGGGFFARIEGGFDDFDFELVTE